MQIIGKGFTIIQFEEYVRKLQFNGWTPNFVVVHNTDVPTQALYKSWHSRKGWTGEQWMKNLASFYAGKGFKACPHLFVGYDRIWVLNPLTMRGTHSPSWNGFTWGVETVGNWDTEPFADSVKTMTIAALGILHDRIGLNPTDFKLGVRGLHFHKEDKGTTHKGCPGKSMVKENLVAAVVEYMNRDGSDHVHITEAAQTADTRKLTTTQLTSIKWVQEQLKRLKYNVGAVDGILGPQTKGAIVKFQTDKLLKNDGIAGPITRLALASA